MPLYEYKGLTTSGKPAKGTKDAPNKAALRDALLKNGIYLSEAKEKTPRKTTQKLPRNYPETRH